MSHLEADMSQGAVHLMVGSNSEYSDGRHSVLSNIQCKMLSNDDIHVYNIHLRKTT